MHSTEGKIGKGLTTLYFSTLDIITCRMFDVDQGGFPFVVLVDSDDYQDLESVGPHVWLTICSEDGTANRNKYVDHRWE
jgi:hypothetical protein